MKVDIARQWADALRSGAYAQGRGMLKSPGGKFCCLGVLCELAVIEGVIPPAATWPDGSGLYAGSTMILPEEVQQWAGMASPDGVLNGGSNPYSNDTLTKHNDSYGYNFWEIAEVIEGQVDFL